MGRRCSMVDNDVDPAPPVHIAFEPVELFDFLIREVAVQQTVHLLTLLWHYGRIDLTINESTAVIRQNSRNAWLRVTTDGLHDARHHQGAVNKQIHQPNPSSTNS